MKFWLKGAALVNLALSWNSLCRILRWHGSLHWPARALYLAIVHSTSSSIIIAASQFQGWSGHMAGQVCRPKQTMNGRAIGWWKWLGRIFNVNTPTYDISNSMYTACYLHNSNGTLQNMLELIGSPTTYQVAPADRILRSIHSDLLYKHASRFPSWLL